MLLLVFNINKVYHAGRRKPEAPIHGEVVFSIYFHYFSSLYLDFALTFADFDLEITTNFCQ